MKRGRNLGLAVVLSSGLAVGMLATAPAAFAATPSGSDLQHTVLRVEDDRGDYARGYDDGRMQGVKDGTHDAEVDCKKQQRMSAKGAGEYQRGWEAGYGPGYEFGYKNTYDKKCGNRK